MNDQSTMNQREANQLPSQPHYDLIIIGSGPAGLTASIYASRYKLTNLVIGKTLGGMMVNAHRVENYPGFMTISGLELGQKMGEQVTSLGAEILADEVSRIEKVGGGFGITTRGGQEYTGKTLIVATGTERRKLSIPGEEEFLGRGVSFCSNCDAPFYKDKVVAVVGGADAACSGSLHIAEFAAKTYLVYRGEALRAEPAWVEQINKNPKIEVIYKSNVTRIMGKQEYDRLKTQNANGKTESQNANLETNDTVGAVELDQPYKGDKYLPVEGIFIEIGGIPVNSLLTPLGIEVNDAGYVRVGEYMQTNVPGLYAAGDLANRCDEFQQITVATAEGSLAAASVFKYLRGQAAPESYGVGKSE